MTTMIAADARTMGATHHSPDTPSPAADGAFEGSMKDALPARPVALGGPEAVIAAALLRLEEAGERSEDIERRSRESQLELAHAALDERREAVLTKKIAGIVGGVASAVGSALGTLGANDPNVAATSTQKALQVTSSTLLHGGKLTRGTMETNAENQGLSADRIDLLAGQAAERAAQADETENDLESSADRALDALSRISEARSEAMLTVARRV